nr:3785_t:CDS:2 [Entrophospora candida]
MTRTKKNNSIQEQSGVSSSSSASPSNVDKYARFNTPWFSEAMSREHNKHCTNALKALKRHSYSIPFLEPVDPIKLNIPDYPNIIKTPMDLGTAEKKLNNYEYKSVKNFEDDVRLIFSNCVLYNGEHHPVSQYAKELEEVFIAQLAKMPGAKPINKPKPAKEPKEPKKEKPAFKIVAESSTKPTTKSNNKTFIETTTSTIATPSTVAASYSAATSTVKSDNAEANRPKRMIKFPNKEIPQDTQTPRRKKTKKNVELKFCRSVYLELKKKQHYPYAYPFYERVDAEKLGVPEYYTIIKNPMDLSKINSKLENEEYRSAEEFEADIRLMFDNCYKFNAPGTDVYIMGKQLESVFNKKWAEKPVSQSPPTAIPKDIKEEQESGSDNESKHIKALQKHLNALSSLSSQLSNSDADSSPDTMPKPKRARISKTSDDFVKEDDDKELTAEQKDILAKRIENFPEELMITLIGMIEQSGAPMVAEEGGYELEIESIDKKTAKQIYNFVMANTSDPNNRKQKSKTTTKRKNLSEQEQIKSLEATLAKFEDDNKSSSYKKGQYSSDDDDSTDSQSSASSGSESSGSGTEPLQKNDNFNADSDTEYIPSKNVAPTSTQKASTRSKIVESSSEYLKSNSQTLLTNKIDTPKQTVATQSRKRKEVAPIKSNDASKKLSNNTQPVATTRKIRKPKNLTRGLTPSMISIMYAPIPNHSNPPGFDRPYVKPPSPSPPRESNEPYMYSKDLVHELRPTIAVDDFFLEIPDSGMTTFTLPLQGYILRRIPEKKSIIINDGGDKYGLTLDGDGIFYELRDTKETINCTVGSWVTISIPFIETPDRPPVRSIACPLAYGHEKPPVIVGLILARNDREITVFGPKGEPITVPEPYRTYKRPIGGLSFKDEIPELAQADTSKEGDTVEPRLIVPSTSGRDRTAGVVLAWHNNWVLVARSDERVVIKRISDRLYKKVLEAAFKYLSLDELPEAHEVTLYEYEDYRVALAKYIHYIREKYSIVHNPKRSAFKEHEPIGRVVNGLQAFWSLKGIYHLSVNCEEAIKRSGVEYRQYLKDSRKRKLELAHEQYSEEAQRNKEKFKKLRHTLNDYKRVEPTALDLITTDESKDESAVERNKQLLKEFLWSKRDYDFKALQSRIYDLRREEKEGQIFYNDNIEQINLDKSTFISACL